MCTAAEEEGATGAGSVGGSAGAGGTEEVVVTAPRIGLDMSVVSLIDWSEVTAQAAIGAAAGSYKAGWAGAVLGGAAAGAATVEAQDGVDWVEIFTIKNDMVIPPNTGMIHLY